MLRGAVVKFANVGIRETIAVSAYCWIPVRAVEMLRLWGASCRLLERLLPRPSFRRRRGAGWSPSFRRRRGAGWRRSTLLNGLSSAKRC